MKVELPKAFQELLTAKARYKMFYGGRAGGKSFAFADALLTLATSRKMLIACVREVQNSIKDSVYKLIADRIAYYRLGDYRLYDDRIVNLKNKSKFIFKGIMEHNAQNIKSLEGVDICWCEEAQKISERAWLVLDPTIRKPGSEIWLSLNREEEADPVWKALALHPDADTIVRKVNYYDNPYCPENMRRLAAKMKAEITASIYTSGRESRGWRRTITLSGARRFTARWKQEWKLPMGRRRLSSGWTWRGSATTRQRFAIGAGGRCARLRRIRNLTWCRWPIWSAG